MADQVRQVVIYPCLKSCIVRSDTEMHIFAEQLVARKLLEPKPRAGCFFENLCFYHHHTTANRCYTLQACFILGTDLLPVDDLILPVDPGVLGCAVDRWDTGRGVSAYDVFIPSDKYVNHILWKAHICIYKKNVIGIFSYCRLY